MRLGASLTIAVAAMSAAVAAQLPATEAPPAKLDWFTLPEGRTQSAACTATSP